MRTVTIRSNIAQHVEQNKTTYFFLVLCLVVGMVSGVLYVGALPSGQASDMMGAISAFCQAVRADGQRPFDLFKTSLFENVKLLVIIWLSGFTYFAVPVPFIVSGVKGFSMGFTMSFMVLYFGFKGFLFSLVSVLPQLLLLLPVIFFLSTVSTGFSWERRRVKKSGGGGNYGQEVKRYSMYFVAGLAAMALVSLVDTFIVPVFIGSVSKLF